MQTHIGWKGYLHSLSEDCRVTNTTNGTGITGLVKGIWEGQSIAADYFIQVNQRWETISFELDSKTGNKDFDLRFESDGQGNWTSNGKAMPVFNGCIDIDISVTPFTNTLPINRLQLAKNEKRRIPVIYIDVLKQATSRVDQVYTKLGRCNYKYENTTNDFTAVITVDDAGLVLDYPGLFTRRKV